MQEDYNEMKTEAQNEEFKFLHVVMDSYIREVVERGGGAIYEAKIVEFYNKKQEPFFR